MSPLLLTALLACTQPRFSARLLLVDEAGDPLPQGWAEVDGERLDADRKGVVHLRGLTRPVLAIAGEAASLSEPVPLGPEDEGAEVEVVLFASAGRTALHFGGDVMLGRRYLAPSEGAPLLDPADPATGARAVVAALAPAFGAADLSMVNLETVLGDEEIEAAYPEKRWLLATPPEALAGLDALGVDLVGLANNHQFDWLDAGLTGSLDALEAWGLPYVGAGEDPEAAEKPVILDVGDLKVGVAAFTSVNGDFVNDQYPDEEATRPEETLDPEEDWMWDQVDWGWRSNTTTAEIPAAPRRPGGAWQEIVDLEPSLSEDERASLWASARAAWPGLQDWVARRGHGGAGEWEEDRALATIESLAQECDLVVVQLHMGYQFALAPGVASREAAAKAAQAGANIVVMHHPHVLQGVEWQGESLVAWSMGNLLFDQDFQATFPSAFLRVVVDEEGGIVAARMVPLWLDAYQPAVAVGDPGRAAMQAVWESSLRGQVADRGSDLVVRSILASDLEGATQPSLWEEHHTLRIERGDPSSHLVQISLGRDTVAAVPQGGIVRLPVTGPDGLELGRQLLPTGDFEDADTDEDGDEVQGWRMLSSLAEPTRREAARGWQSLQLVVHPGGDRVRARTVARIPMPEHRAYADADGIEVLDPEPRYSVRLQAWVDGQVDVGRIDLRLYHFDDLDPTRSPTTTFLRELVLEFAGGPRTWSTVDLDLPEDAMDPVDGLRPNMATVYLGAEPPERVTTVLRVDDLAVIEWRAADEEPDLPRAVDFLRASSSGNVLLDTHGPG